MHNIFTIGDNEIPVVEFQNVKYVQKPLQNIKVINKLISLGIASHHDSCFVYYPFYENAVTLMKFLDNNNFDRDVLANDLINAVKFIHDNGIVHGDIHLENIIVDCTINTSLLVFIFVIRPMA